MLCEENQVYFGHYLHDNETFSTTVMQKKLNKIYTYLTNIFDIICRDYIQTLQFQFIAD